LFDPANYWFTLHSLAPATTAAAVLLLGVVVALRERHSRVSLDFLLLTLPVCIWFLGATLMYASRTPGVAVRWGTVILLAVSLIGPASLNFASAVLGEKRSERSGLRLFWLAGALFSFLSVATSAVVGGVNSYEWGFNVAYGWLGLPVLAFTFGSVLLSLRKLFSAYRTSIQPRQRTRLKYLGVAFSVGSIGIVDSLGGYGVPVYPIGFVGVAGFVGICAWAIWKYRLVDITPALAANKILAAMNEAVLVADNDGYIQVANQPACRLLDLQSQTSAGQHLNSLSIESIAIELCGLMGVESGRPVEVTVGQGPLDGTALEITTSLLRDSRNAVVGTVFIMRDVTERRRAEREIRTLNLELEERIKQRTAELQLEVEDRQRISEDLRRSRDQLDVILNGVADGIVVQDTAANVIFANAAGVQSLGIVSLDSLQQLPFQEVLRQFDFLNEKGESCRLEQLPVLRALHGEQVPDEVYCFLHSMTGRERWYILNATPVFDRNGEVQFAVSIFKEISERKRAEHALFELSVRDELTGLYNRRELNRQLLEEVDRFRRYHRPASLVLVDIDHFKLVNDTYGHQAGDAVLKHVAEVMQGQLRSTDKIARYGGEEFAVVLPETTSETAYNVADQLRQALSAMRCRYLTSEGNTVEIAITVSLGIAGLSTGTYSIEEWVEAADAALYFSKRTGRNKTTCSDPTVLPEQLEPQTSWATLVYDHVLPLGTTGRHD
jgi:diguanylate cyclase (GGDEF)-like protein/PAS domain S-box-containing protein